MKKKNHHLFDDFFAPHRRGRVINIEGKSLKLSRLPSSTRFQRLIEHAPEVFLKISPANIFEAHHLQEACSYIGRNGKVDVFDERDQPLTPSQYNDKLDRWVEEEAFEQLQSDKKPKGVARRIIISMPEGTDEEKFKAGVREYLKNVFGVNHEYTYAFHTPSNDKKTHQPHCHVLLKNRGLNRRTFYLSKSDLHLYREHLAFCLDKAGLVVNSTSKVFRGVTHKGLSLVEFYNLKKVNKKAHINTKKKKTELLDVTKKKINTIKEQIQNNQPLPDDSYVINSKKARSIIDEKFNKLSKELKISGEENLSKRVLQFKENFPKIQSQEQAIIEKQLKKKNSIKKEKQQRER